MNNLHLIKSFSIFPAQGQIFIIVLSKNYWEICCWLCEIWFIEVYVFFTFYPDYAAGEIYILGKKVNIFHYLYFHDNPNIYDNQYYKDYLFIHLGKCIINKNTNNNNSINKWRCQLVHLKLSVWFRANSVIISHLLSL